MVGFVRMSKQKRTVLLIVAAVVVALVGWAAYLRHKGKAVPVLAAKVEKQDIVAKVTANGKIQAEKKVDLAFVLSQEFLEMRDHCAVVPVVFSVTHGHDLDALLFEPRAAAGVLGDGEFPLRRRRIARSRVQRCPHRPR
jgi:hypothetical protein